MILFFPTVLLLVHSIDASFGQSNHISIVPATSVVPFVQIIRMLDCDVQSRKTDLYREIRRISTRYHQSVIDSATNCRHVVGDGSTRCKSCLSILQDVQKLQKKAEKLKKQFDDEFGEGSFATEERKSELRASLTRLMRSPFYKHPGGIGITLEEARACTDDDGGQCEACKTLIADVKASEMEIAELKKRYEEEFGRDDASDPDSYCTFCDYAVSNRAQWQDDDDEQKELANAKALWDEKWMKSSRRKHEAMAESFDSFWGWWQWSKNTKKPKEAWHSKFWDEDMMQSSGCGKMVESDPPHSRKKIRITGTLQIETRLGSLGADETIITSDDVDAAVFRYAQAVRQAIGSMT